MASRARRPKAASIAYNQGDGVFHFEVLKDEQNALLVTLRENKPHGRAASIVLDEHELTVMISKLFECLINLQARRS